LKIHIISLSLSLFLALQKVSLGLMTVGDLVAVNGLILQLSVPFNFLGYTYQELRQAYVDMGYMKDVLLRERPRIKDRETARKIDEIAPLSGPSSIEFENVHYTYSGPDNCTLNDEGVLTCIPNEAPELLKGVSFKVRPGESAAIVGPSGSGKSTTLRLITRILEPNEGRILLDGVDVRSVTTNSVRKRVAVVPQDCSLFDETIEFNIRYGNMSASAEEVRESVRRCNLEPTVERLRDGLSTRVGERGAILSGGERQKVSIARAILKNPSLILCDEITSSVDAFAEREIVSTLSQASRSTTSLTIAHRLSSIRHCDVIIVLDKGRVRERGTHNELMSISDGLYRRMWEAQNENIIREREKINEKERERENKSASESESIVRS